MRATARSKPERIRIGALRSGESRFGGERSAARYIGMPMLCAVPASTPGRWGGRRAGERVETAILAGSAPLWRMVRCRQGAHTMEGFVGTSGLERTSIWLLGALASLGCAAPPPAPAGEAAAAEPFVVVRADGVDF